MTFENYVLQRPAFTQPSPKCESIRINPEINGMPVAFWDPRCQKDKYDNDVTLITVVDTTYRMVHYTPVSANTQRASIFGGRGIKASFRSFWNENTPSAPHTINVSGFYTSWGNGNNLGVNYRQNPDNIVDIPGLDVFLKNLESIQDDDDRRFTIEVLCFIDQHDLWMRN